jgi:hypothetical protein
MSVSHLATTAQELPYSGCFCFSGKTRHENRLDVIGQTILQWAVQKGFKCSKSTGGAE